ncbi:hypothetical protein OIU84_010643 [Salix udensis]|uniref:Uncharacterized protein n=1 Tax=Salix udensis TaxID=889485 RepID=A0AAD6JLX0_9ROSI|nr:hypothetical protein OIU84_010643 [Salix udensis]
MQSKDLVSEDKSKGTSQVEDEGVGLSLRQLSSSSCVSDGLHKPSCSRAWAWERTDEETPCWKEPGLPDPVHRGFKAFVCFLTLKL